MYIGLIPFLITEAKKPYEVLFGLAITFLIDQRFDTHVNYKDFIHIVAVKYIYRNR
jgi:hypothetical protein